MKTGPGISSNEKRKKEIKDAWMDRCICTPRPGLKLAKNCSIKFVSLNIFSAEEYHFDSATQKLCRHSHSSVLHLFSQFPFKLQNDPVSDLRLDWRQTCVKCDIFKMFSSQFSQNQKHWPICWSNFLNSNLYKNVGQFLIFWQSKLQKYWSICNNLNRWR